jgi:hypothetical protein
MERALNALGVRSPVEMSQNAPPASPQHYDLARPRPSVFIRVGGANEFRKLEGDRTQLLRYAGYGHLQGIRGNWWLLSMGAASKQRS